MSRLSAFNKLLGTFLKYLTQEFPDLTDIRVIETSVDMLKSINPRGILEQFMYYLYPFHEQIFKKEEEFFTNPKNLMNHRYFTDTSTRADLYAPAGHLDDNQFMQKFSCINQCWDKTTEVQKNRIWKFFQALLKFGAMASNDPEHKKLLEWLKDNPQYTQN